MLSEQISAELVNIFERDLAVNVDELKPEDRLIEDLGLDSVAFAIALLAIEDNTGIRVSEEKLRQCRTVGDIAQLLRSSR